MSTYPTQPGQPHTYQYEPPPTNALGIAGFVVSLSGLVVCMGLICPVGLVLSLIALTKEPRGFAIAGTILGALGTLMGVLAALLFAGVLGSGFWLGSYFANSQTYTTISIASSDIDYHYNNNNSTLPDEPTGNALISSYTDEWGNSLKYELTAGTTDQYTISSAGEDGVFGTIDDIVDPYQAYNWGGPATVQTWPEEEVEGADVENAFGLAADKIVKSFPVGSDLPTRDQVSEKAGQLLDPWLTPMKYTPSENPPWYDLESAGPDQQWGTGDDLKRPFYFAPTGQDDGPL
ncbi:MAG: DUF4190 domain-containing protein [Planctomycetota bacterium]